MKYLLTIFCFLTIVSCQEKPAHTTPAKTSTSSASQSITPATTSKQKTILFFGDSLTAGYGLEEEESFPSLIQDKVDAAALPYTVVNAGLSGETSSGGKSRIDWVLSQPVDVFVLELGANDMLRGLPLGQTKENLESILDQVSTKYPDATLIVAGMQAPPNMGAAYSDNFSKIFGSLAEKYQAKLIPFLLDGVAGMPDLNLKDGKHPNAEGQKIVTENVWKVLQPLL